MRAIVLFQRVPGQTDANWPFAPWNRVRIITGVLFFVLLGRSKTVKKADRFINVLLVLLVLGIAQAPGRAQTYSVTYNFGANPGDPSVPQRIGAIVEGKDGALYSATEQGGAYG